MNALLVAIRGVHFASALLLFGELVFVLVVARPLWRLFGSAVPAEDGAIDRRLDRSSAVWLALTVVSGVSWLVLEASSMSGLPLAQALDGALIRRVLTGTVFGRVWLARGALAVALAALLIALGRQQRASIRLRLLIAMLGAAACYLALLADVGHASVESLDNAAAAIAADAAHLLASGAWLGALPGFVFLLRHARSAAAAAASTRRFSTMGAVCVAVLTATGLTNAWYLVGDIPALVGTAYGRLLVAKLALFAAMLALAMANRWYLSVRLPADDRHALRSLVRNAVAEFAAGIGVIAIVGALGVTTPAMHETPVWPFPYTLSFDGIAQSAKLQMIVAAAATLAVFAVGAMLSGVRAHRARLALAGAGAAAVTVALIAGLLAEPAYPTTYAASPVGYTVDAIARGSAVYAAHCIACHGADGRGEDASIGSLAKQPPDLAAYASKHRDGDLYWRIAHGTPGSPMPAFSPPLTSTEVWQLVQFLYALAEARYAREMTDNLRPLPLILAPDFTFEAAGRPQETLGGLRGRAIVLLVLYSLPQSAARLEDLASNAAAYARAGARVIALPLDSTSAVEAARLDRAASIAVRTASDVAPVYLMFARGAAADGRAPEHVEFLVDRQGELRMRWLGVPDPGANPSAGTLAGIGVLAREPPRDAPLGGHGHGISAASRKADIPLPASTR